KFVSAFEELDLFRRDQDLSAGKWRQVRGLHVPSNPQHERRKYLQDGWLYKFAGYGRYGREKRARAETLAGWVPPAGPLENGFLPVQWIGDAQTPKADTRFLDAVAAYLAAVRREFATGGSP